MAFVNSIPCDCCQGEGTIEDPKTGVPLVCPLCDGAGEETVVKQQAPRRPVGQTESRNG